MTESTNSYDAMFADIKGDMSIPEETRWDVVRMSNATTALTREFSRLMDDTDLNEEARQRKAAEAMERYGPKVRQERTRASEALAKQAEALERASMPRPKGQSLNPVDTQSLLADQMEAQRIDRQLERLGDRKGPFTLDTSGFLKQEYERGMQLGGVEGGAICRGVLRVARERGIGDDFLDSLRSDDQRAKLYRAQQLMMASWSIPTEPIGIPRALQGPRKLSRRPEQRRDYGHVLMGGSGPAIAKWESQSGIAEAPQATTQYSAEAEARPKEGVEVSAANERQRATRGGRCT